MTFASCECWRHYPWERLPPCHTRLGVLAHFVQGADGSVLGLCKAWPRVYQQVDADAA